MTRPEGDPAAPSPAGPPSAGGRVPLSEDLAPAERENLQLLDRQLHDAWGLGANVILNWCAVEDAVDVLLVPHYAVAACSEAQGDFVRTLISGRRELSPERLREVAARLGVEPVRLRLYRPVEGRESERDTVERLIRRYSISYVPSRAVALLDIVGFSLLSPFEQMIQLNSLSHSINAAHSCMLERHIGTNFARSSTGDGFYLWNRETGRHSDANLYHFMHLVLADNAIARRKNRANSVPLLRTGFHCGSCYEFYQAEGLRPTLYDYIVGDVTIELARMIERALPGQIMVGEFQASGDCDGDAPRTSSLEAIDFMQVAQHGLTRLSGMELAAERIEAIKCYLTGARMADGDYSVRRLTVADKHGLCRNVFNAKVNIYRHNADPIFLGLEDRIIASSRLSAGSVLFLPNGARAPETVF